MSEENQNEENEWADDPDMQEFLEWADQPGPWDEEDDKIHTVGGLTNDKKNGFMSFVNKTMEPEKDIFEQWQEEAQARPWYIKLWDKIRFCYKNELRYYPKYLKYGLENIFYWFKIIWKDRSWDHDFIFVILKHKLKKQAKDLRKYSHHVGAEYYAERIELCVRLIDKIESNFYELESLEFYKLKSWFEPIEDQQGYSTWESKLVEERIDEYFAKYPRIYKQVTKKGYTDKVQIASRISYINQQRAIDLLFKVIANDIKKWWY